MAYTIVIRKNAKKDTVGTRKTSRSTSPRVTQGPYELAVYPRTRRRLVARFYVAQRVGKYPRFDRWPRRVPRATPWYVIDMESEKPIAAGTSKTGYEKKDAIAVARSYRDKYGEHTKFPF